MSKTAASKRVARGARWLDENFPGWESRIDTNTLALNDPAACICGQVFQDEVADAAGIYSGYTYARATLFSEANHWITQIVKSLPIPADADSIEADERSSAVAIALGFEKGRVGDVVSEVDNRLENSYVEYEELQAAWCALLAKRTAK